MKIGQKLILGFTGIAVLFGTVAYFALYQLIIIEKSSFKDIPETLIQIRESSRLNELAQLIRYYDEVLTQSARNFVFTQDEAWKKRYHEIEPKLDEVIGEAIEHGDRQDKAFFESVNEANLALVDMEKRAMQLVNGGMPEEAVKLLESDEYWDQKRIYSKGLQGHIQKRGTNDQETILNSTDMVESSMKHTRLLVQRSTQSVSLTSVIILTLGIGLSVLIAHSISTPIKELSEAAILIGKGKLDIKIKRKSRDEIGDLSDAFIRMTDELNSQRNKLFSDKLYINSILDSAGECIIVINKEGNIETFNRTAEKVFGYRTQEIIGKNIKVIMPPSYREKHDTGFARYNRTGEPKIVGRGNVELEGLRKDGSVFPADLTITEVKLPDTNRKVFIGMIRDISESKKIKEELEMTARFPGENPNPILRISSDGVIIYANKNCTPLLQAWDRKAGDKIENHRYAAIQDILKNNKIKFFEETYGETTFSLTVVPVTPGDYVNIYAYDITQLHKTAQKLQESEARVGSIVKAALEGIVTVDHKGIVQLFNPAAARIFGYKPQEVIGQSVRVLLAPEVDRSQYQKYLASYTRAGEEKVIGGSQEVSGRHKNGTLIPLDLSLSEMVLANGQRLFIGIVRDITKRKKTEEEIKEMMEAKDEFSSMVSHELRTPLAISKEALSLLSRRKLGKISAKQEEVIRMASTNIERLQILINNILDASKLSAGKMVLSKETVNINDLVRESFEEWKLQAGAKHIEFKLEMNAKPVLLFVDTVRFGQVLANLLSNAVKFTPELGAVSVKLEELVDEVQFTIQDSGCGIAQEDIPKIFEKFHQLQRTPKPGMQGTGLGLNIAKSLIELHGGRISIKSRLGAGTTAVFTIPKA